MRRFLDRILGRKRMSTASLPEYVSNEALTLEMIPPMHASWPEIADFALTFSGYQRAGSFNRCTLAAHTRDCTTLSEMRACLFFELRSWNALGRTPDRETMYFFYSLLDRMRGKVERDELE